jgi:hypothetical protein
MKDDPELQIDDSWSNDNPYPPKRRRIESGSSKSLRILLVIFLVLIIGGGILYFLGKRSTGGDAGPLQSKVIALEQRIAGLEKQLAELQGKISTSGPDPALLQRVDALAQKVEALERKNSPQPIQKRSLLLPQNRQSRPKSNTTRFRKEKLSTGSAKNTGSAWRNSEN